MGQKKQIKKILKEKERLQTECSKMRSDIGTLIEYFNKLENKPLDHNILEILFNHETRKVWERGLKAALGIGIGTTATPIRDYSRVQEVIDNLDKKSGDITKGNVEKLANNFNISSDKKYEGTAMFGHSSPACDNYVPESITEEPIISLKDMENYGITNRLESDFILANHKDIITFPLKETEKADDGYQTIQVPVGSFVVPPTENNTINKHLSVIELLNTKMPEAYVFLRDNIFFDYFNGSTEPITVCICKGDIFKRKVFDVYKASDNEGAIELTYKNLESLSERGIVRALSSLEICENQECAPAKEEERPTHPHAPRIITELPKTTDSLYKIDAFRYNTGGFMVRNPISNDWYDRNHQPVSNTYVLEQWLNGVIYPISNK